MNTVVYKKGIPGRLHKETKDLLDNRPRKLTLKMISDATGIERRWLEQFSIGYPADPSVNRVEVLNLYLKSLKS